MLVPICEECFNKYIKMVRVQPEQDHRIPKCKECLDIYMGISNPVKISRPTQISGMPVKEYYELFEKYVVASNIPLGSMLMNDTFVRSLSDKNKEKVNRFLSIHNARPTDKNFVKGLVYYLEYVEHIDNIFDKEDDLGPMDTAL